MIPYVFQVFWKNIYESCLILLFLFNGTIVSLKLPVSIRSINLFFPIHKFIMYVYIYIFFSHLIGIRNDEQCAGCLYHLVKELPLAHQATLRFLLRHFCHLCCLQFMRGNREPPTILIQTLCHLFLRPPWERIM